MLRLKLTYTGSQKKVVITCKKCRKPIHKGDPDTSGKLCAKCRGK